MKKKLIEVALPLEAINAASAREKSIRHGHPSTLHLWWSRKPLAACRAVLFASLVDDPSEHPEKFPTEAAQDAERQRLFGIIEDLVQWENSNNPQVLEAAREEIRNSCKPPIPPETDDFDTILLQEALKFDGYHEFDEKGQEVSKLSGMMQEQYQRTGSWRGTLRELRGCLFWWNRLVKNEGKLPEEWKRPILDLYRTIRERWGEVEPDLPPVLDPFCGGGSIPLEAQRLGLEAHASDLNPVAVLITKALIEIPPKFAGQPPINREVRRRHADSGTWTGAAGLAEDVRYYGQWMRNEAWKRIGHLYPKVRLPKEQGGGEATVIAWIWARTVKCPNPACGAIIPLASKFWLSTKPGQEAWVDPIVVNGGSEPTVEFKVCFGAPIDSERSRITAGTYVFTEVDKSGQPLKKIKKSKATFRCLTCAAGVVNGEQIDEAANKGRIGVLPIAIVADGPKGRTYVRFGIKDAQELDSLAEQYLSSSDLQDDFPNEPAKGTFASNAQGRVYGFKTFADYFTPRQLASLVTFSKLVTQAREQVNADAVAAGMEPSRAGGYADAVTTYLAIGISRLSDICNSLCMWESSKTQVRHLFTQQGISMLWDFAEANVFARAAGDFGVSLANLVKALEATPATTEGSANQVDATSLPYNGPRPLISSDPPYYNNVSYADLADFFHVWLRRSLGRIYPDVLGTMLSPKTQELVATSSRFGGDTEKAEAFFEKGLRQAFTRIRSVAHPQYPVTVYYAFRQSESDAEEADDNLTVMASTGWEKMLEGLLEAGFQIVGTWPIRSELSNRRSAIDANSLASSIVLVCRPRPENAPGATRREFLTALRGELEEALLHMMHGNIAPVDLAQATIGPGMAVYSRYSKVIETDGSPLRVRTALQIINQELDAILSAQEGDYDGDTRFCLAWFEQFGMNVAAFGEADVMARAKNTSVQGLHDAGVLEARAGRVRLLKREEYPTDWNPLKDARKPVWECTQQLVRALQEQGEPGAARLCAQLGSAAEPARDLAYRLYNICERKGWAQEALAYNSLVMAWPEITRLASSPAIHEPQTGLFARGEV